MLFICEDFLTFCDGETRISNSVEVLVLLLCNQSKILIDKTKVSL